MNSALATRLPAPPKTVPDPVHFRFQLFVADLASNSAQALFNLRALCDAHLVDRHEIEVVDVFQQPARALAERVHVVPTLVIAAPEPRRRLIGNLSETPIVLRTLGIVPREP